MPPARLQFDQALARCRQTAPWVHRSLSSGFQTRKTELPMKVSARNQLKGTIVDVVKGATTSHIRIDIGGGVIVNGLIGDRGRNELKLAKGKPAAAVIKA